MAGSRESHANSTSRRARAGMRRTHRGGVVVSVALFVQVSCGRVSVDEPSVNEETSGSTSSSSEASSGQNQGDTTSDTDSATDDLDWIIDTEDPPVVCGCKGEDYFIKIHEVIAPDDGIGGKSGMETGLGWGGDQSSGAAELALFDRPPDPTSIECDETVGIFVSFGCGELYEMAACDADGACLHLTSEYLTWVDGNGEVILDLEGDPTAAGIGGSIKVNRAHDEPHFEFVSTSGERVVGSYFQCQDRYLLCR